ncbi:hypothetical protein [Kitasatospora sp. NPDC088346]|uniref:hypothetical protein n=1 Tax=Kitasatospora sp. NPDC088346 TaxID=3364073 RepID=UPI0037F994E1
MTLRRRHAGAAATLLLTVAGCAGQSPAAAPPAAGFEGNGVSVAVRLDREAGGAERLRVTFRPQEAGFHLYSVDLPAGGVSGLGIPTRLAVRGGLAADGTPVADRPLRTVSPAGLDVELPVYPDGPVTLTLPVHRTGEARAEAVVSYGACSEGRCLIPVFDRPIAFALP